jgi:hypothetical protein
LRALGRQIDAALNRLEHAPPAAAAGPTRYHKISHDPAAIERVFVDLFLDAHPKPPKQIILDLDATDDPIHGDQEGRFFHGYYDGYGYLPLYIFCGRHLLAAKLRRSNIDAAAGALEEIERIVTQIRRRWSRVRILLRADSGFAREDLMAWCERHHRVDFVFGLAKNARLIAEIEPELAEAQAESVATDRPARRFKDFRWSTLDSWSRRRRVVRQLVAAAPRRATAGRGGAASWRKPSGRAARPTRASSSPRSSPPRAQRSTCMNGSIAREVRWKTG